MANLAQLIKKAAIEAVIASKPCDIITGKVVSVSPLKVGIDQKLTLASPFLVVGYMIQSLLTVGDTVVMVRAQGGQKYYVIDKVVQT